MARQSLAGHHLRAAAHGLHRAAIEPHAETAFCGFDGNSLVETLHFASFFQRRTSMREDQHIEQADHDQQQPQPMRQCHLIRRNGRADHRHHHAAKAHIGQALEARFGDFLGCVGLAHPRISFSSAGVMATASAPAAISSLAG
jgi:hypothetical protein